MNEGRSYSETWVVLGIGSVFVAIALYLVYSLIHFMFIDDGVDDFRKAQIENCAQKVVNLKVKSDVEQMNAYAVYQACLGRVDYPYARHLWNCTNRSVARIQFDPKTLTIRNKEEVAQISRDCIKEFKQ